MTNPERFSLTVGRLVVITLAGCVLASCACPGGTPVEPIVAQPVEPPPKPEPPPPPPPPPPPQPPSMEVVVQFDYDMAVIHPQDMAVLERHVRFLLDNTDWRIRIEGHCDDRGSERYNLELGERRAEAVRSELLAKGIADSRMDVISYGESRPVAEGTAEQDRAQNRRAVVIYLTR